MSTADEVLALVSTIVAGLDGVEMTEDDGVRTWSAGGRPFARAARAGVEVKLDPAVAAAALRTPDTSAAQAGGDWISFRPTELDRYATDRLTAWIISAHRIAAGRATGQPRAD